MRRSLITMGGALTSSLGVLALAASCSSTPVCKGAKCGAGGAAEKPYVLTAPVDVRRDHLGVVHVYGKTDGDAMYGDGYMQATDRLYQMDLQRRHAAGRQAEILGDESKDDDLIIRVLGIAQRGHENAVATKANHPDTYALVEAWVAGVNARIDEVKSGKAPTPTGFVSLGYAPEDWTVDDVFAVAKLNVFGNGDQTQYDVLATAIQQFEPQLYSNLPFLQPLENSFILEQANGPLASLTPPGEAASAHGLRDARSSSGEAHFAPTLPSDAASRLASFGRLFSKLKPKASNNFAVDGRHTTSGHSLIAGDPHLDLRSPSQMWLHHINSSDAGGTLDVEGWSFVGTPGVSLGHNADIAWTATTSYPDVTDLWDVVIDDQNNAMIAGKPVPITSRTETYDVKGAGSVTVVVQEVPGYGVFLPDDFVPLPLVDSGHHLLLNWTGFQPTNETHAFFKVNAAKNVDDFDAAIDLFELGSFNFVGASRDAITYRSSPLVPDRGDPSQHAPSYALLSGDDASSFWTGKYLTGDQLPHSRATAGGVIVTANNDPFAFTKDGNVQNDPFYFGAFYDPGTRAQRIHDAIVALAKTKTLDETDMEAIQSDIHSILADQLLPMLDASYAKVATDPTLAAYKNRPDLDALLALLDGWDRRMQRTQTAPAAFEVFMYLLSRDVIADDMGIFFQPVLGQQPIIVVKYALLALSDPSQTFLQNGKDATILKALDETAQFLTGKYGKVDSGYTWADYHATAFPSESIPDLDGGSVPTDGAEGTVDVSSGVFFDDSNAPTGQHVSTEGSIYRMVASWADSGPPRAFFNMARGNAGEPNDPHYDDLTSDWTEGRYQPLLFDTGDISADATESITINPK